jgi:hypothetical protein
VRLRRGKWCSTAKLKQVQVVLAADGALIPIHTVFCCEPVQRLQDTKRNEGIMMA